MDKKITDWQPRFMAYCKYYGLPLYHEKFKGESFIIFIFDKSADFKRSIGKSTQEPLSPKEHKEFTKYLQELKPLCSGHSRMNLEPEMTGEGGILREIEKHPAHLILTRKERTNQ